MEQTCMTNIESFSQTDSQVTKRVELEAFPVHIPNFLDVLSLICGLSINKRNMIL